MLYNGEDIPTDTKQGVATFIKQGVLYFNAEWDRFAMSFNTIPERHQGSEFHPYWYKPGDDYDICTAQFVLDAQRDLLEELVVGHREGHCHHVSAPLTLEVCHRVRKVLARFETRYSYTGYIGASRWYPRGDVVTFWRADVFDAIETYLHLCMDDGWQLIGDIFAGEVDESKIQELQEGVYLMLSGDVKWALKPAPRTHM
ncbi:hypothetical protein PG987_006176 [Apiospora arundinis]